MEEIPEPDPAIHSTGINGTLIEEYSDPTDFSYQEVHPLLVGANR
ncbi:hypothetical protein MD484_g8118, partial [Candolleomyces efflorescens]